MVGWHHRLNGHEFEETLGDGEGQGSLACCSSWGHKESDMIEQLNKKVKVLVTQSWQTLFVSLDCRLTARLLRP